MVDDLSSTDTQYSASYAIQQLQQKIQAKEHAATTWAIKDFKNKKVLTIEDIRKGLFKEYADVFEERTYQELPPHHKWDHKIDLVPDWKSKVWKPHTYPLSYGEQKELDAFIKEKHKCDKSNFLTRGSLCHYSGSWRGR